MIPEVPVCRILAKVEAVQEIVVLEMVQMQEPGRMGQEHPEML